MPRSSTTLDEVTKDEKESGGNPAPEQQPEAPATPPASGAKTPPPLPDKKTATSATLESKIVVIHGPAGIGKTTLASQWAGGDVFFFNCAGELGDLEVYQQAITSWTDFRNYAWAVSSNPGKYTAAAIDTADVLGRYCSEAIRKQLGIVHESDLDWGKGWSSLRDAWQINMAKLAAIPNFGLLFVTHSDEKEVKTRNSKYDRWTIRGVKAIRETMTDMADLVLFVDYSSDDDSEKRVIKTKPSRYWDAKERGERPRLPAEIEWPLGTNGWELLKGLWEAGT